MDKEQLLQEQLKAQMEAQASQPRPVEESSNSFLETIVDAGFDVLNISPDGVLDLVTEGAKTVANGVGRAKDAISETAGAAVDAVGSAAGAVAETAGNVLDAAGAAAGAVADAAGTVTDAAGSALEAIGSIIGGLLD